MKRIEKYIIVVCLFVFLPAGSNYVYSGCWNDGEPESGGLISSGISDNSIGAYDGGKGNALRVLGNEEDEDGVSVTGGSNENPTGTNDMPIGGGFVSFVALLAGYYLYKAFQFRYQTRNTNN